jgi:NAD(P)H-nitrite reductase large subunit
VALSARRNNAVLTYTLEQLRSLSADRAPVDRCVCHGVLFADLVRRARETTAGFDELRRQTRCSTSCGLCKPYILAALATGATRFPVMSDHELAQLAGK